MTGRDHWYRGCCHYNSWVHSRNFRRSDCNYRWCTVCCRRIACLGFHSCLSLYRTIAVSRATGPPALLRCRRRNWGDSRGFADGVGSAAETERIVAMAMQARAESGVNKVRMAVFLWGAISFYLSRLPSSRFTGEIVTEW